ncbi:glycosyltransferase family 2 protein [Euzebya sp.]|uniref:glycosyltransferase family 2 protein n=1 Tax=Euzebya sp. TaxID=1971409 RepID=UPI003518EBFE
MQQRVRVTVLMTVHDRRDTTLACLRALGAQAHVDDVDVSVVLVDDGSSDGTADAVRAAFPAVRILQGDGELFWNGGMRAAWAAAWDGDPDFYLWLNDDTLLDPGALRLLIDTHAAVVTATTPAIVAGAITDPDSGAVNYSGVRQDPVRRLRFDPVVPDGRPIEADTMNGNAVLVPRAVARRVGTLSRRYTHGMGDYDYGLRARRVGCAVWVAPRPLGRCSTNPGFTTTGEGRADLRRLRGVKHLPPEEWRAFARRWAGPAWPAYWLSPYLRRGLWVLADALSGGRRQRVEARSAHAGRRRRG